jgi:hypothetical protein
MSDAEFRVLIVWTEPEVKAAMGVPAGRLWKPAKAESYIPVP